MREYQFDPDKVDVSESAEYEMRVAAPGPMHNVIWATDDAALAKRTEMLDIDREMAARWIETMEKLVAQDLEDAEFTTQRMMRLRLWTKERKRRQHNLHYKYDPKRRRQALVARDTARQLEPKIKELRRLLDLRRNGIDPGEVTVDRPQVVVPTKPAKPHGYIAPDVDETTLALIKRDTGITDLEHATDADILDAYKSDGNHPWVGEWHLALLRGRELPERPAELG